MAGSVSRRNETLIERSKYEDIVLNCGDNITIHRPENPGIFFGHTCVYRNDITRAIDYEFELDGSRVLIDDPTGELLLSAVSNDALGNWKVASTLNYFIELTNSVCGVIVGVGKDQLDRKWVRDESLRGKVYVAEALDSGNLVSRDVCGDIVLFPANIFPRGS